MLEQLFAIFRNTLVESIRQPIYFVMVGLGIIALILNLGLSSFTLDNDNKFLIDMGMATIFLVGLLIAAFVATRVLTREIEDKTVLTVVSKPVGRPLFLFGKFLGVYVAIMIAATILSSTFLLTVRHEVLQRAADELDWPVILFGAGAIFISVGLGIWCNYFYGWVFTSTTIAVLFPMSVVALVGALSFAKEGWAPQFFLLDLDPQMLLALMALAMALLVICSIAIAASSRFGQVMTLFFCVAMFLLGLLNDHLFGRHAYTNASLARITEIRDSRDIDADFSDDGDWYEIRIDSGVDVTNEMSVLIAADPLGLSRINTADDLGDVVLRDYDQVYATLVKVGDHPMRRPPRADDYLLSQPPKVNWVWRILWSIPPDLQFLVLIDPLTQGHSIPMRHMGMILIYSLVYSFAMLSLAVILFQKREVG